jgi:hypothetical protein
MIHITHDGWAGRVPDGQLLTVAQRVDRIWHIDCHDGRSVATSRRSELVERMIGITRDSRADMIFLISSGNFRTIVYRAISALTAFGVAGESPERIRRTMAMWAHADKLTADEVELVVSRVAVPDSDVAPRGCAGDGPRAAGATGSAASAADSGGVHP